MKLVLVLTLVALAQRATAEEPPTVLHAARVFDGERVLKDAWVVVRKDTIAEVTTKRPSGETIVELGDATLLAGLIDVHVHLLLPEQLDVNRGRMMLLGESSAAKALRGLKAAQRLLDSGITTLRDPGDFDLYRAHLDVRDAIEAGLYDGPRILAADRFITRTGGHYDDNWAAPDQHLLGWARVADGPEELVKAVRAEVKAGADWIKLAGSGGYTTPGSLPELSTFTDEELGAVVKEAHRLGRKVAVHAHAKSAIEAAIHAGVDSIEHGIDATPDQLRAMAKKNVFWVPTLLSPLALREGWERSWRPRNEAECASLRTGFAAHVPIAFGTDSGLFLHGSGLRQLALFVACGITPTDALRTATVAAATMLGLAHAGRVKAGYDADLIAVPGNPLEDIATIEHVSFVMRRGHIVRGGNARP